MSWLWTILGLLLAGFVFGVVRGIILTSVRDRIGPARAMTYAVVIDFIGAGLLVLALWAAFF